MSLRAGAFALACLIALAMASPAEAVQVTVDGVAVSGARVDASEGSPTLVSAAPILEAFGAEFELEKDAAALNVRRAQDGARFRLDFATGIISLNGHDIGKLPNAEAQDPATLMLTPNAVAILTGSNVAEDAASGDLAFSLDRRLKPQVGFRIVVNGRPLADLDPRPRSVGPVLLLPLAPIAEEFGHEVEFSDARDKVTVTRAQDGARISLDLATGLVEVNGRPTGVTPAFNYADVDMLLLPSSAIETLTGGHVRIQPGDEVFIDLDDRLDGLIAPGPDARAAADETPPTLERVAFLIGNDVTNFVEARGYAGPFNMNFRAETQAFPTTLKRLQPSWVSLRVDSLDGYTAIFGDYVAGRRELAGVDVTRIRGAALLLPIDGGGFVATLGQPVTGSKRIDRFASIPTFSGYVGGVRYYDSEGVWEAGVSARVGEDGQNATVVASGLVNLRLDDDTFGRVDTHITMAAGLFRVDHEAEPDIRVSTEVNWRPFQEFSVRASGRYTGVEFNRGFDTDFDDDDDDLVPGADDAEAGVALSWRPFERIGLGARFNHRRVGVTEGRESQTTTYGVTATGEPIPDGPFFTLDLFQSRSQETDGDVVRDAGFDILAIQEYDRFTFTGRYAIRWGDVNREVASLSLNVRSFRFEFPEGAHAAIGPSASVSHSEGRTTARAGVIVNLDSGLLFGPDFRVHIDGGRAQPIAQIGFENESAEASNFLTARARWRINDNLGLELGYNTTFQNDHSVRAALTGAFNFGEPRRYGAVSEGRGVLKGQVFLDANGDGVRQDDEDAFPGAPVRVGGSGLSLRADKAGWFTIHNMPTGTYTVTLQFERLPLGYRIAEEHEARVAVADGRVTHVDLPISRAGQIRGRVARDADGDGVAAPDEEGLEGVAVRLEPGGRVTYTTNFGQYAFDDVGPGDHTVFLDGAEGSARADVTIADPDALNVFADIAAP